MKISPHTAQPPRTRTAASLAAGAALLSIATISPAHADSVRFQVNYNPLGDNDWQEVERCARAKAESNLSQLLIGLQFFDVAHGPCERVYSMFTGKRLPTDPVAHAIAWATETELCSGECKKTKYHFIDGRRLTKKELAIVRESGIFALLDQPDTIPTEDPEAESLAESNERKARKIAARVLRAAKKNCSKLEQALSSKGKLRRNCQEVVHLLVLAE